MDGIDVWRAAKLLVDEYGADAPSQAVMKADAMRERGDLVGMRVWKRVMRAIAELQGTKNGTQH